MREGAETTCRRCGEALTPAPGWGGVCTACRDTIYPSLADRGGKWSPLALGVLSIVCDVLMIPTILAFVRGISELRTLARREREGYWHEEHPEIRTGAIWGMLLASLRPFIALGLVAFAIASALSEHEPAPLPPMIHDETGEILEALRSDDDHTLDVAVAQLEQSALVEIEADRILDAVDRGFGHDDPELEAWTRSRAVEAVAFAGSEADDRLAEHYPERDANARSAILYHFAARGTHGSLRRMAELAIADTNAEAASLPHEELVAHADEFSSFLPALLELPNSALYWESMALAGNLCADRQLGPSTLAPARERLTFEWSLSRDRLRELPRTRSLVERFEETRQGEISDAILIVDVLGCADADGSLREALALGVPELSAAAIPTLLLHGARLPAAEVRRVAADPIARREILRALPPEVLEQLPESLRGTRARAESEIVVREGSTELDSIEWVDDVQTRLDGVVHVFRVTFDGSPRYAAVWSYPLIHESEIPVIEWWDHSTPWTDASPAALAHALVEGEAPDEAMPEDDAP